MLSFDPSLFYSEMGHAAGTFLQSETRISKLKSKSRISNSNPESLRVAQTRNPNLFGSQIQTPNLFGFRSRNSAGASGALLQGYIAHKKPPTLGPFSRPMPRAPISKRKAPFSPAATSRTDLIAPLAERVLASCHPRLANVRALGARKHPFENAGI